MKVCKAEDMAGCFYTIYQEITRNNSVSVTCPLDVVIKPNDLVGRLLIGQSDVLSKLLDTVRRDDILRSYFSEKILLDILNSELKALLPTKENLTTSECERAAADYLRKLHDELNSKSWQVIIPIVGLSYDTQSFEIGGVQFRRSIDSALPKWFNRSTMLTDSIDRIAEFPCATLRVHASDSDKAKDLGIREVQNSLNVLLLYLCGPTGDYRRSRPYVAMHGRTRTDAITILTFSRDEGAVNWEYTGPFFSASIDSAFLSGIRQEGFDEISKMLSKKPWERTEIEQHVLAATAFFANAVLDEIGTIAVVNFCTSLECLLKRPNESSRKSIPSGVNRIWPQSCYEYSSADFAKDVYDLRSKVVHFGGNVPPDFNYTRLAQLCFRSIVQVAKSTKGIQNSSDLFRAIDEGRLLWSPPTE